MANLGLLGALGGLGEGITKAGVDWQNRREQALAWARQEAAERRKRAEKMQDDQAERQFQTQRDTMREEGLDKRNQATIDARLEDTNLRLQDNQKEREFKSQQDEIERTHDVNMKRLESSLRTHEDAASKRLADSIADGKIVRLHTGVVNKEGYAPVYAERADGTLTKTGQRVKPEYFDSFINDKEEVSATGLEL